MVEILGNHVSCMSNAISDCRGRSPLDLTAIALNIGEVGLPKTLFTFCCHRYRYF
jgi:hypothetical protein